MSAPSLSGPVLSSREKGRAAGKEEKSSWLILLRSWVVYLSRPVDVFRRYERQQLRPDFQAGLTVAVLMLPQSLAFAQIANLPPQYGLFTAIVASCFGALWGSSSHLQTGPTNTSSLLILSVLLSVGHPGSPEYLAAAGMLAFMAGLFRLLMGLARFGVLVNFISDSVIIGFTTGAEFLIIVHQLRHLLRIDMPENLDFLATLSLFWSRLPQVHPPTLLFGGSLFLLLFLGQRFLSRFPTSIFLVSASAAAAFALNLQQEGIRLVGPIAYDLPRPVALPVFDFTLWSHLSSGAFALASIGLVEATSIARSLAAKSGEKLDSNQEFVGQGMANMACGFLSGYPCSGSFTRSLLNFSAGAQSPLSNVFASLILLLTLLLFAPLVGYIPMSALAALVILNACRMTNWREIRRIWQLRQNDRIIMMVTLGATFTLPLHVAVLIGILLSLAVYLRQTSTPRVREVLPDEKFEAFVPSQERKGCPQISIVEILGDFYFGAASYVEEKVRMLFLGNPSRRYLLLRMQTVEHLDISGIHALESIAQMCRNRHGELFLTRIRQPVLEVMRHTGLIEKLGEHCFLIHDKKAVEHLFYRVIDPAVCIYECPVRIFRECQNLPKNLWQEHHEWRTSAPTQEIRLVEARDLWKWMTGDSPPLVLDVRDSKEFRMGHVPHAKLLPLPVLLSQPPLLEKARPIVLVCRDQRRSERAAGLLIQRGYSEVSVLRGGLYAWEEANLLIAF